MVAHDNLFAEFARESTKWSDKRLLEFRKEQVQYLFAGMVGSQDQKEREALIELVDKEFERRYKIRTEKVSIFALAISIISIFISIFK